MRTKRFFLTLACSALAMLSSGPPAEALPHDARIDSVVQGACGVTPCTPGSAITDGSVAGGIVTVRVHAEADLGLEWVRLEARNPGDSFFYCLERWTANEARTLDRALEWDTSFWTDPRLECRVHCSDCIEDSRHHHGARSLNTTYDLRVVARETGRDLSGVPDARSPTFQLKIQNAAAPPAWTSQPRAARADGSTGVTLEWAPSDTENAAPPEPPHPPADVKEYRFLRIDPSGRRTAFAIDATNPGRQGCTKVGTIAYRCTDRPPGGPGDYRYSVAAIRGGFSGDRCELSAATCVVGPLNDFRSVTVARSVAEPTATVTSGGQPAPGTAGTPSAAPEPVDPGDLRAAEPPASEGRGARSAVLVVLAVVVLLAVPFAAAMRARAARR